LLEFFSTDCPDVLILGGFNLLRNKNKDAESDGIPQRCVGKKKQCKSRATDISARRTVRSSIE
jgi:hypothetical protein